MRAILWRLWILSWLWAPTTTLAQVGQANLPAPRCGTILTQPTFYSIAVQEGYPVESIEWSPQDLTLSQIGAERVQKLGEGAEGSVYRVHPEGGGPAYLLKGFHPGDEFLAEETFHLLNHWRTLSSELPDTTDLEIARPQMGPYRGTLIFEDIRGESVEKILSSKMYSYDLKVRFAQKFMLTIENYIEAMTDKSEFIAIIDKDSESNKFKALFAGYLQWVPDIYGITDVRNQTLKLYFTPRNVIYDTERDRFVIIDPI